MELYNVYCVLVAHRKRILLYYNTLYSSITCTSDVNKLCTLFMYIDMEKMYKQKMYKQIVYLSWTKKMYYCNAN